VDAFVDALAALALPLHGLINCAGVCMPAFCRTADGFEVRIAAVACTHAWSVQVFDAITPTRRARCTRTLFCRPQVQLGTNHVGPAYLTLRLLPALRAASAADAAAPPSRVVFVASNAPNFSAGLAAQLAARDVGGEGASATGFDTYALSKAYNVLFARHLAARLRAQEAAAAAAAAGAGGSVHVFTAHPGFVATPIQAKAKGLMAAAVRVLAALFALSPARGAHSTLFAATAPGLASGSGYGPSDYNFGLTAAWAPRGDIFDDDAHEAALFEETLRVLAAKGRVAPAV
jgi:NAD(P)-dependent dehydrogenase (short-subunit alcohol dehydrogenase family)